LRYLSRTYEHRDPEIFSVITDPEFDFMRADLRFQSLMQRAQKSVACQLKSRMGPGCKTETTGSSRSRRGLYGSLQSVTPIEFLHNLLTQLMLWIVQKSF
jgi:hypothetical protein